MDPALQGVLVGALIGFIGSAFAVLVSHRLALAREEAAHKREEPERQRRASLDAARDRREAAATLQTLLITSSPKGFNPMLYEVLKKMEAGLDGGAYAEMISALSVGDDAESDAG
jgi:hypothetical protein